MTDSFEPNPGRGRRMLNLTAMGYAIASLLLLGACCYGVYWLGKTIENVLSNLN